MSIEGENESLTNSEVVQTKTLFSLAENRDPVTKLPFETPEVRSKIIDIFKTAIKNRQTLVYIFGDIDSLKKINDLCGHSSANEGIKKTIKERETYLASLDGAESVYVFRPQAGGDEFKAIVIFDESSNPQVDSLIKSIRENLNKPTQFNYGPGANIEINCSYGIVAKTFLGSEEPSSELQKMEGEAEKISTEEKLRKIQKEIEKTIQDGKGLSRKEYTKLIVEKWGTKRITPKALEAILEHFLAKCVREFFAQQI